MKITIAALGSQGFTWLSKLLPMAPLFLLLHLIIILGLLLLIIILRLLLLLLLIFLILPKCFLGVNAICC